MVYTIELEKLTEEQLEAFKIIDKKAVETEIKRREESIYSPEDIKAGKVYADLYKAYFYLKPMYDNMRNTDVKKVITQSEVLPIMEKIFRWADHNKVAFEKFEGELVAESKPESKPETKEEAVAANIVMPITIGESTIASIDTEPTWEPGGGAEVEQPHVIPLESKPEVIPMTAEQPEVIPMTVSAPTVPVEEVLSPVESMTQQKLNEILASIPAVEKI